MQKAGYKDSPGLWFTKEVKKREKRKEGEGRRERERRIDSDAADEERLLEVNV